MTLKLTEAKLRQIIREEIMESFGGSMNPRGLEMTPEEVMIQQRLMNSPKSEKFLNDLAKAVRAQLGPAAQDPNKVGALLKSEVMKDGEDELSEGPSDDYLKDKRARALGNKEVGWSNATIGVALGGISAVLMSWHQHTGLPIDSLIDHAKYILPLMFAGVSATEALEAIAAGREADEYTRILKGKKKPPAPAGKLELPKTKF